MSQVADTLEASTTVQEVGTVTRTEGELAVATASGTYRATRAVSCLVAPEVDDLVLVATAADGRCWVLAVLEREAGAGAVLTVDGDLSLRPEQGRVNIAGPDGITLASGDDLSVVSAKVEVNTVEADITAQRLGLLGRFVTVETERLKTVAATLDQMVERFSLRAARVFRRVEDVDQLQAGRIDHRAEKTVNLRGKNTLVTAEKLVKVDGDQVHLG